MRPGLNGSRIARRLASTALLIAVVFASSSCTFYFGCTRYTIFEPTPTSPVIADTSACESGDGAPPPVVPEVPIAVLLPLSACAVGAISVRRRRRVHAT